MESTYTMNPILGDIPKYNVKICLGSISPLLTGLPLLSGLDKSIGIQGTIESIIGYYLKLF